MMTSGLEPLELLDEGDGGVAVQAARLLRAEEDDGPADLLERLNRDATGSATFVTRLCVLDTPPSLDLGEVTDKGSINQRAVLMHRAAVVDAMYEPGAADAGVIVAGTARRA